MAQDTMTHPEVRPFQGDVPQEVLDDLRWRIAATRWPEKETVPPSFYEGLPPCGV